MRRRIAVVLFTLLVGAVVVPAPARAFNADQAFAKGTWIGSLEGGGGFQENLESGTSQTGLDLWYAGVRVAYVPFGTTGPGVLHGALDLGLEGLYVGYAGPVEAYYAGLGIVGRYNFLSFGRFVPFAEVGAHAGRTDLRIREIDSEFAFLLQGTVGASLYITDALALWAGYRLVHVSNGNSDLPNRGFEAHTGLAGVSLHFR